MHIMVRNNQRRHTAPIRAIRAVAEKTLSALGCPEQTGLSIIITGDRAIRSLNREYLGKDRPTNVISFSLQEGEFGGISGDLLGDVVVSADTAAREAEHGGISGYERLIYLLVHGILHLTGYDHERSGEAEAKRMQRKEKQIWKLLQHEGMTTLLEERKRG